MTESILKRLRDASKSCPNREQAQGLQTHVAKLQWTLHALSLRATDDLLRDLNGLWARAYVLMDAAQKMPDPTPPIAPAVEAERLAA